MVYRRKCRIKIAGIGQRQHKVAVRAKARKMQGDLSGAAMNGSTLVALEDCTDMWNYAKTLL
jgi:hypothetical protein